MILADTSVWIDHMRGRRSRFSAALENDLVLVHPFVIGELACGKTPCTLATPPSTLWACPRFVFCFVFIHPYMDGNGRMKTPA